MVALLVASLKIFCVFILVPPKRLFHDFPSCFVFVLFFFHSFKRFVFLVLEFQSLFSCLFWIRFYRDVVLLLTSMLSLPCSLTSLTSYLNKLCVVSLSFLVELTMIVNYRLFSVFCWYIYIYIYIYISHIYIYITYIYIYIYREKEIYR